MSYTAITKAAISAGKALTQSLAQLIGSNFEDHESRIATLEADTTNIPTGVILELAVAQQPPGTLECLGQAVSRETFSDLFAVIGTRYGAGDGSTTFNLPDKRGRVAVGAGSGSGLTARTQGQVFGSETHVLTESEIASHTHTVTDPGHAHGVGPVSGATPYSNSIFSTVSTFGNANSATTTASETGVVFQNSGGGQAHNNMQASLVTKHYIRT